jgi:hypothetical protein
LISSSMMLYVIDIQSIEYLISSSKFILWSTCLYLLNIQKLKAFRASQPNSKKSNEKGKLGHTGCSTWSLKKLIVESLASRTQLSISGLPIKRLCRRSHEEQNDKPTTPHVWRIQCWDNLLGFWCLETLERRRNKYISKTLTNH